MILLLAACLVVHLPETDEAFVAAARLAAPHTTAEGLAAGRALVLDRCANCHAPPAPADTREPEWPERFATMQTKAEIGPEEAALIEDYLRTAHAVEAAAKAAKAEEPAEAAGAAAGADAAPADGEAKPTAPPGPRPGPG